MACFDIKSELVVEGIAFIYSKNFNYKNLLAWVWVKNRLKAINEDYGWIPGVEQEGTWNFQQPTYLVVINFITRQLEINTNTISTNLLIILSFNETESLMCIKENII